MSSRPEDRWFERYRRKRDVGALAKVFDRTGPELMRLALYLTGDTHRAEDLVQATYLTALEKADTHHEGSSVVGWLLGILAKRARHLRRQEKRSIDPERLRLGLAPDACDPVAGAAAQELRATLHRTVRSMEEPYRQVLILHLEHGLSSREIGETLNRGAGTVRSQITRGLELLRGSLPAGLVAGVALATLASPSLSAVRAKILAQAAGAPVSFGIGAGGWIGGTLVMKKIILAIVVSACGAMLWWSAGDPIPAKASSIPDELVVMGPRSQPVAAREADVVTPVTADTRLVARAANVVEDRLVPTTGTIALTARWSDRSLAENLGLRVHSREGQASPLLDHVHRTDAEGKLELRGLPAGEYLIQSDRGARVSTHVSPGQRSEVEMDTPLGATVGGRVIDSAGRALMDADVWLWSPSGPVPGDYVTATPKDGTFALRDVPSGSFVAARAPHYSPCEAQKVSADPGSVIEVELRLTRPGASLRGRVLGDDGAPVAGALVRVGSENNMDILSGRGEGVNLLGPPPVITRADADGKFLANTIGVGNSVPVLVTGDGYAPWEGRAEVQLDETNEILVQLAHGASLWGVVRDEDGRPLTHATVSGGSHPAQNPARAQKVETKADGSYRIGDLPSGELFFMARADGLQMVLEKLGFEENGSVEWNPVLTASAVIRGRLMDESRSPLVGYQVRGERPLAPHLNAVTDSEGRFTFDKCDRAAYSLAVFAPGAPQHFSIHSVSSMEPSERVQTITVPSAAFASARIVGKIVGPSGTPVPRSKLWLLREPFRGGPNYFTDGNTGMFALGPLPADRYRLRAYVEGHAMLDLGDFELGPKQTLDLGVITLQEPSRFTLTLLEADKSPASQGSAVVRDVSGQVSQGARLRDGTWKSRPLHPGTYTIGVWGADMPFMEREIEFLPGEHAKLTWTAPAAVRRKIVLGKPTEDYDLAVDITYSDSRGVVFWLDTAARWHGKMIAEIERAFEPGTYTIEAKSVDGLVGKAVLEVSLGDEPGAIFEIPMK